MNQPVPVEFIDSASNEKLSLSEIRRLKLISLCRGLVGLADEWRRKKKYSSYPRLRRFIVFYAPQDFLVSYTAEFIDFPAVSCEIGRNVLRYSSADELVKMLGEQTCGKIRELRGASYMKNKAPKMWWEGGRENL